MSDYPRCPVQAKLCFPSRGAALRAREGMHHRIRAYRCRHCAAWHLTKAMERAR